MTRRRTVFMLGAMSATLEAAPPGEERRLMTAEEFDVLPEDAELERWIIDGRLYERPASPYGFPHGRMAAEIIYQLQIWVGQQSASTGVVLGGGAAFCLRREPPTNVGIDVAYITAEQAAATAPNASVIEGAPLLAVEIMSLSDQFEDVTAKIEAYLQAGVALVWRVEPALKFLTVFRPDSVPRAYGLGDELTAEPHLPGFRVTVAEIFA